MKKILLITIFATVLSTYAFAAESVVFVHGRSGDHCDPSGSYTSDYNNYWGSAKNINTSLPKYFVQYDGSSDPRTWGNCRAQSKIYQVFENKCQGTNSCTVICHSAGCYATEYFISKSSKTYNINFILASSSAAGGSELANMAFWASDSMVSALKTSNARGSYNHNDMKGNYIFSMAGYKGTWYASALLPGEDDGAVSFHSTCGINSTGSFSNCLSGGLYSGHYVLGTISGNTGWSSSKNGYYRTHVGDNSSSINDAMRLEWNACRANNYGCN